MKKDLKISSLLIAMLLMSGQALGAGLGKLSVSSLLGQPLRAEIELLSAPQEDLASVEAKLAGPDAYTQAHIERSSVLSGIQVRVEKDADGKPVVRLSSAVPVNDPFVDLLIELNWSSGRVLREYTVLLDPVPVRQAEEAPVPTTAPTATSQQQATQAAAPEKPAAKATGKSGPGTYGPVKDGDTLHSIAASVLPPDVSLDMMMASLYHANERAFVHNNMNLLKKGQVLTVPDRDTVMHMYSPHQARQLVSEHTAAWNEMRSKVAGQAAASKAEETKTPSAESGRIVAAKPQTSPAPVTAPKDVLTLSKGEAAKAGQATDAENAAKDRQLKDAQSRINDLEKMVADLQSLMAEKDKAAANAKPGAAAPAPAPKAAPAQGAKAPVPPPPQEKPGLIASLLSNPLYIGGVIGAVLLAGLLWVVMVGRSRRNGLSTFEQSVMTGGDQFKTSIFKTTGGAKSESGMATQSGATTDFSRLGLGSIDTHEVDPIAEAEVYMAYGRDAQAEEILKEALAKEPSRHEIALKLLEIYASRKDKASFETHASELYANLGNPDDAIWQKAAAMGHELDPENPLYRMFSAGQEASLQAAPVVSAEELLPPSVMEEHVDAVEADVAAAPAELEPEPFEVPEAESILPKVESYQSPFQSSDLDFEPEVGPTTQAFPSLAIEDEAHEIAEIPSFGNADELSLDEIEAQPVIEVEPVGLAEELASPRVEEIGDLSLESLGAAPSIEVVEPAAAPQEPVEEAGITLPDLDFSDIDLELGEEAKPESAVEVAPAPAAIEAPAGIDPDLLEEVNTKLDLAKAYLEMGDREGAREILDEVLKEGDAQQKQAAEAMMAEVG